MLFTVNLLMLGNILTKYEVDKGLDPYQQGEGVSKENIGRGIMQMATTITHNTPNSDRDAF